VKTRKQALVILKLVLCALLCTPLTAIQAQISHPQKIAGKPISFYLNHNAITQDAKLYYEDKFTPSDNNRTFAILDSVVTRNREIRPFYFFVFNQIMKTSDGTLSEYVSAVCSRYFSQYPCEFMQWQNDRIYEASLRKWADYIAFDLYTPEALKNYTDKLKIAACKTKELDNFVNEVRRITTELNEH